MKYSKQYTTDGFVTVDEYVSNKYDNIHKSIYIDALNKYIYKRHEVSLNRAKAGLDTVIFNPKDYNFIEIADNEYHNPSQVCIISKRYPYTKETVSLSPYWNTYQHNLAIGNTKTINDLMLDEETIADAKLKEIDYARGIVIMYSKTTDKEFSITFDYINKYTKVCKESTLYNTFMYKLKHQIYGK